MRCRVDGGARYPPDPTREESNYWTQSLLSKRKKLGHALPQRSFEEDPTVASVRSTRNVYAERVNAADQTLSIKYRPVADLKLDSKNPRIHTQKQIRQIASSITAFGFNVPVLVNGKGKVVAGHGRVLACQLLGIDQVPTIALEHLSDVQAQAFLLADNKLTENATWDDRLLAEQLQELSKVELNFSLEVTGFEMGEIDVMIEGLSPAPNGDTDDADVLPESDDELTITKVGDLWVLGPHRVLCADSLKAENYSCLMEGLRAAAVITDPPFNDPIDGYVSGFGKIHHPEFAMASGEMTKSEFTEFLTTVFTRMADASAAGSLHYIFMDWRHTEELLKAAGGVFSEFKALCVWDKGTGGQGSLYRSQHELVFIFKRGTGKHQNNVQLAQFGRYRTNVWCYPRTNSLSQRSEEGNLSAFHPTVKPVAMIADAIMDCSGRNDIVLDPFLGSGSTLIAAERAGRCCYGIEIEPRYVDTIVRRWEAFTGKTAVHMKSGKTWKGIEEETNAQR